MAFKFCCLLQFSKIPKFLRNKVSFNFLTENFDSRNAPFGIDRIAADSCSGFQICRGCWQCDWKSSFLVVCWFRHSQRCNPFVIDFFFDDCNDRNLLKMTSHITRVINYFRVGFLRPVRPYTKRVRRREPERAEINFSQHFIDNGSSKKRNSFTKKFIQKVIDIRRFGFMLSRKWRISRNQWRISNHFNLRHFSLILNASFYFGWNQSWRLSRIACIFKIIILSRFLIQLLMK